MQVARGVAKEECSRSHHVNHDQEGHAESTGAPDRANEAKHGPAQRTCPRGGACKVAGWFVVVAALLVAAGVWKAVQLRNPVREPLRVAISPWPGYEFASLAQTKGYFEQEGVDVRLLELGSLGDCRRTFERGQADGFFGTMIEVIESDARLQRSAEIVCVVDYSDGADCILARDPIGSVADLRGKRIAVEHSSVNVLVLTRALELAGLAWSDVTVVYMPAMQMPEAMSGGAVDAAVTYPPLSLDIRRGIGVKEVFTTAQIPGEVVDLLAFDAKTAQERRREIDAFVRAFFRAQQYAAANREEGYALMAARQRITAKEFEEALSGGIRLVGRAQQERFLGPEGSLRDTVASARAMLNTARGASEAAAILQTDAQSGGDPE